MGDRVTLAAIPRAAPTNIRAELVDALEALAGSGISVVGRPVDHVAPPVFILSPDVPFATPTLGANGGSLGLPRMYDFRFVWWCVVGRMVIDALDQLEAMAALVAASLESVPGGSFDGIPVPLQMDAIGDVKCWTAQAELHVRRTM